MKQVLAVCGLLLALNAVALAHNVVSGVYADGLLIEGEIGFSSGEMAKEGVQVNVFDEHGEQLGQAVLDDNGAFAFQASRVQKHVFEADLGAGHVANMVLEADELSAGAEPVEVVSEVGKAEMKQSVGVASKTVKPETKQNAEAASETTEVVTKQSVVESANKSVSSTENNVSISSDELQRLIRSTVAQQVRPLQKELHAYKEKVMFRDIAGGLGFIFGLFGVAAWMAAKRHEKKA